MKENIEGKVQLDSVGCKGVWSCGLGARSGLTYKKWQTVLAHSCKLLRSPFLEFLGAPSIVTCCDKHTYHTTGCVSAQAFVQNAPPITIMTNTDMLTPVC